MGEGVGIRLRFAWFKVQVCGQESNDELDSSYTYYVWVTWKKQFTLNNQQAVSRMLMQTV